MSEHTPTPWRVEGMTLWIVADNVPKRRMHVADIRGWGYLTGKGEGALGLSDDEAFAIQEANAALIVKAVNNHDRLVKALSDLLEANKMLASLSPHHHNRNAAIAGQEVAERAARDVLAPLIESGH